MSPLKIAIVVYLAVGVVFGVLRIISDRKYRQQFRMEQRSPADTVVYFTLVVAIGWWVLPILMKITSFRYRNRLSVIGFNKVVSDALNGCYSSAELVLLKQVIREKQQKAIAAGNPPEEETVKGWMDRIDEKIESNQTGADFEGYLRKVAARPVGSQS